MKIKRFIVVVYALMWAVAPAFAQSETVASASGQQNVSVPVTEEVKVVSIPKTDFLSPFDKLDIDGPMNVRLVRVATGADTKIVYDTKGNISSKFKASVDKSGVLRVEERFEQKRENVTDVTIYYNSLSNINIAHATAVFDDTLDCRILDIAVSGGAKVTMSIKALDTFVECTGRSSLVLSGESRYFKINASTAKVEAWGLQTVSSTVEVSHSADVRVLVSERLDATTSTSGKLFYRGHPDIVRGQTSLFGGDIICVD